MKKIKLQLLQILFACLFLTEISAQDLYTGVWRGGTDGYALYGGLTWNSFVSKWQTLASQNLRLVDISTYLKNGTRYYNGVWRAGTDAYALYGGVTWSDFVTEWQTLAGQGLRLIDIETYVSNTTRLYVGVWRAGTDGYALYGGLNWNDFVAKWQQLAGQNLRLIDVATYISNGTRVYTGVWRAGTDGYALYGGVNYSDFVAEWKTLAAQNLRLISVTSYLENSTRLYVGVWRGGSDGYALWNGTDWESTTSKWAELAASNLRLICLDTYDSDCSDNCLNNVLMDDDPSTSWRDTYDYQIKAGKYHCEGSPTTCPLPGANDVVTYSWPNLHIGTNYWARNSVLFDAKDKIFTLPFTEIASNMGHNAWLYSPGSWHHAIDYYEHVTKTFQITAAAPGKVIYIGWDVWSGNTMVISHDVGTKKDVYRTIYMHLQDGPLHDCDKAWTETVPTLSGSTLTNYKTYLNNTGCPLDKTQRNPTVANWGKNSQKIDHTLLNTTVTAGQQVAWAGSTGPGGCGCADDGTTNANTHLHIFFAHRDPVDNHWYFFDPYGIYSDPSCYPTGVNDAITTSCARYPISWKNGKPGYPAAPQPNVTEEPVFASDIATGILISPNPSTGNITITYNSGKTGSVDLAVYDKTGMVVFRKTDYALTGNNNYHLNFSNFIAGVYYVEINNNGIKSRDKFIINK
ncbi:MAG TPA: T9SS type A sorting domain-containing protein [Parafilimonas sp.]|nr:T9SS type A sorting domain-containing protein [Parafilimonas sp.]